jgi:hypothetical protein
MRAAAKLNKGEGVVRLLLPPDEQLAEAFPTFTESGGHFSMSAAAGTTAARQAATAPRTGDLRARFICFSLFVRYLPASKAHIAVAGWVAREQATTCRV